MKSVSRRKFLGEGVGEALAVAGIGLGVVGIASPGRHPLLDGAQNNDTTVGTPVKGDIIRGSGASPSKWERLGIGAVGTTPRYFAGNIAWGTHGSLAHINKYVVNFDFDLTNYPQPYGTVTLGSASSTVIALSITDVVGSGITEYININPTFIAFETPDAGNRDFDVWYEVDNDDGNGFIQRSNKTRLTAIVAEPVRYATIPLGFRDVTDHLYWLLGIVGPTLGNPGIAIQLVGQVVQAGGTVTIDQSVMAVGRIRRET